MTLRALAAAADGVALGVLRSRTERERGGLIDQLAAANKELERAKEAAEAGLFLFVAAVGLAPLHLLDDNGANGFGLVQHLTMQTVYAFVRVDFPCRMNGLHRALVRAGLTGAATFLVAFQPVEHPHPRRDRQGVHGRAK